MNLLDTFKDLVSKLKLETAKKPIYVYCSKEFLDALVGKMHENGFKKRTNRPWYRKERW